MLRNSDYPQRLIAEDVLTVEFVATEALDQLAGACASSCVSHEAVTRASGGTRR